MNLIKETWRIKNNPIQWYLGIILIITAFYSFLLIPIFGTAYTSLNNENTLIFNITETSYLTSIIYNPASDNQINFEFVASIIVLIGGFGGFCYIFFLFCDSYISEKKVTSGFFGLYLLTFIIDIVYLNHILFEETKEFEKFFLISLIVVSFIILCITILVLKEIKKNYENRKSIINFLKNVEQKPVTFKFIETISRMIIKNYELFIGYILLLTFSIICYGFLKGFNILSIISTILFCLLILHGYSQLILMKIPSVNIELKKQNNSLISSIINHNPHEILNDVFILNYSEDTLKILKNKENEIIEISKYCICSIQNNDYEIYTEKISFNEVIQIFLKIIIYAIPTVILSFIIYLPIGLLFFTPQSEIVLQSIFFISLGISIAIIYLIRDKFQNLFNRIFH